METDETVLLAQVFGEEPGAFEAFLDRYRSLFYSVFYGKGFPFPRDFIEDIYQSFVLALARNDYHKLRSFQGRNNCSLATFLQVVATRFALDELRKFKRHPRGRGMAGGDDESFEYEVEDPRGDGPVSANLDQEELDTFHNLLFGLEWKRISVVLWTFRAISRPRIADVMDTSRANIDALYKRAKDQMKQRFTDGSFPRIAREVDSEVLSRAVRAQLRELLVVPSRQLHEALLQPACKERALIGLLLVESAHFRCSAAEISRIANGAPVPELCQEVLAELAERVLPKTSPGRADP
jgi:RNA polymerase sigma factor (sigma-70 family)